MDGGVALGGKRAVFVHEKRATGRETIAGPCEGIGMVTLTLL
jgi:hypothetical protein